MPPFVLLVISMCTMRFHRSYFEAVLSAFFMPCVSPSSLTCFWLFINFFFLTLSSFSVWFFGVSQWKDTTWLLVFKSHKWNVLRILRYPSAKCKNFPKCCSFGKKFQTLVRMWQSNTIMENTDWNIRTEPQS